MEILNIVWKCGRSSVSDVRAAMDREVAHNTVQTIMRKLSRKGYLTAEVSGKTHYYTPKRPETKVKLGILHGLIASVFEGSHTDLIRTLGSDEKLTREDIDALQAGLDVLKARRIDP